MTQIKKITDKQGNNIYLRTHTKAVVDSNGYTAESRLQAMQDEINQKQLEVGAVPSDLIPTESSTNWVTSGGVYTALDNTIYKAMGTNQLPYVEMDLSQYPEQNCSLGTNKWYMAGTGAQRHIAIPVVEGEKYRLTDNIYNSSQIAWLSSNYNPPYSNNQSLPLASGQTDRIIASNKQELIVPSGASYLAITKVDGAGNVRNFILENEIDTFKVQNRLSSVEEDMNTTIPNIQSQLSDVDTFIENQYFFKALELSEGTSINRFINYHYNWESSTTYTGALFDISDYADGQITITKNPNGACRVAFLVNNSTSGTPSYCAGYSSYIEQSTAESITYDIPIDCNFIYVYTNSNGIDVTPTITLRKLIINSLLKNVFKKTEDVDISDLEAQDCALGSNIWYLDTSNPIQTHVALPVTPGEIYKIYGNYGYLGFVTSAYNPPYTNNESVPYVSGYKRFLVTTEGSMFKIPNNTAYLILTTIDGAGNAKTYTIEKGGMVKQERIVGENTYPKLRICHWNVGHFALGTNYDTTISPEQYETMQKKWALKINDINADIIMCCEYNTNFVNADSENSAITARNAVFAKDVYEYAYVGSKPSSSSYMQTAIFANKKLSNVTQVVYPKTTQAGRYYQVGELNLNGKTVKIVETHLDWNQGTTGADNRETQIQKLIDDFSAFDYVIIGADFNTESSTEYDSFKNAGYKMANHGYLGDFVTYPAGDNPTKVLDNIICKGFTINGICVVNDAELSDHCCIYADFTMIE